jgi:hypothetical protein
MMLIPQQLYTLHKNGNDLAYKPYKDHLIFQRPDYFDDQQLNRNLFKYPWKELILFNLLISENVEYRHKV